MIDQATINQHVFFHPFTAMLAGPSKSGKTTLLEKILRANQELIQPPPERIMYCFSRQQDIFDQLKDIYPTVEFITGLPDFNTIDANTRNLIILDDLMAECNEDNSIVDLFTKDSHHKNISTFYITQNLYSKGKNSRTISLNCNYIILFNNPRDRLQIQSLGRQMFPGNAGYLKEAYEDAVINQKYGYLLVDLSQQTSDKYRLQTNILPTQSRIIYKEK